MFNRTHGQIMDKSRKVMNRSGLTASAARYILLLLRDWTKIVLLSALSVRLFMWLTGRSHVWPKGISSS